MPTDITPIGTTHATDPSDPVEIIRRAVNAAHAAGFTVSTVPDLGVHCVSGHGRRWETEQRVRVISPLGAVLITLQPEISDADSALAHALGVNVLWVIGFGDGCGGAKKADDVTGPAARLYGEGYDEGKKFRAVMHRRFSPEASMSGGSENPAGKMRGPVDSDAARELSLAVLVDRLGALTVSEGLDALADSFAARMGDMGAEQAGELRIFEQTLRQLAEEARGSGV